MARQPRDLTQSEFFHLTQRGADRQDVFTSDHTRVAYEEMLADAFERHHVELHAYALMTNHTHLLVHVPPGGELSDAMHHLGSRYALWYNQLTDREGPLFTSRFHSTAITTDSQLIQTDRYIHRNPLAFVPAAALVAYRWSSLAPICGRRPVPSWLSTGVVAAGAPPDAYLDHVLTPQPADRFPFGHVPPLTPTALDDIVRAVSRVTGVAPTELTSSTARNDELRSLSILLAVELRAADSREIAHRFGLSDPRSARRCARSGRARLAASNSFRSLRTRVLATLDDGRPDADAA